MSSLPPATSYVPRREARSVRVPVRGLDYHLLAWGDPALATPQRPPLVMVHGWMDVGASFQFVVDALAQERYILAPDWRGFGLTRGPEVDSYWFPDYLGDLDALLDALSPDAPVDLAGHSMGGNVSMLYAGVRPARIRRLVNLEGFGMPATPPAEAPQRYTRWLDELKTPQTLRTYVSADEVAARLRQTNPRLRHDRAAWLARRWARPGADGRWAILGDPAHKRVNPVPYRPEEILACWARITAPVLWLEGDGTEVLARWSDRYPRSEFERRLTSVPRLQRAVVHGAGHMLHHDQPEQVAAHLEAFLDA